MNLAQLPATYGGYLDQVANSKPVELSVSKVVAVIREVVGDGAELHKPSISIAERLAVQSELSDSLLGRGVVRKFEAELCRITETRCAAAVSSGTAALHLALLAAGVEPGDEVLVPSLTFAATANAVVLCGATPNFIDGRLEGVNAYKLRRYLERETKSTPDRRGRINKTTDRRIRAAILVHLAGTPAMDTERVADVLAQFGIEMVEDACQALGSSWRLRGVAAAVSFNRNKIVTCDGGGALLTNCESVAAQAHHLANVAPRGDPWLTTHSEVGFNYRMGSINAALGLAQLSRLGEIVARQDRIFAEYRRRLNGLDGIRVIDPGDGSSHWLTVAGLDPSQAHRRDELLRALQDAGLHARALHSPLHSMPHWSDCPRDTMGETEDAHRRMICLPS